MVVAVGHELEIIENIHGFHHVVPYQVPEEKERLGILKYIFHSNSTLDDIFFESIAKKISGMIAQDIVNFFLLSVKNAFERIKKDS